MKGSNLDSQETAYACKCLNVRLRCKPLDKFPDLPTSPDWKPIYVEKDEDIKIVFPHLTLRTRKRAPYIPDPAKTARYTSLTCLCCQTLVYRVHQIVSVDDKHNLKEGPLITKGWTETEVLRSASGWIEVFNQTLSGEAISRLEQSSSFSPIFGIVLASASSPQSPTTNEPISERAPEEIPKYQLPPIAPIFPEPKSHTSLFAVLASLAGQRSASLRSEVEEYIDGVVKAKIEEIRSFENQLKRDVQFLLNKYNEGIKQAEQEENAYELHASIPQERGNTQKSPEPPIAASVIRDFVPMAIPPARRVPGTSTANPAPRVSSLSASLATSSFHHPKAQSRTPPKSPTMSLQSASSATLTVHPNHSDVGNVYRWSRNTNEQLDVATSYNYFLLEEEMERRKQENTARLSSTVPASQQAGPSTSRAPAPEQEQHRGIAGDQRADGVKDKAKELSASPSPKSKGKRKVTFDVKVNQVAEDGNEDAGSKTAADSGDMLFDFEDEVEQRTSSNQTSLPLIEQPTFVRPQQSRKRSSTLPDPFSSIRPSFSLPTPSQIRRPETPVDKPSNDTTPPKEPQVMDSSAEEVPVSIHHGLPIPGVNISTRANGVVAEAEASNSVPDEHTQMLNKLAASMPSHRAAWKANPDAFKAFLSNKADDWVNGEAEEDRGGSTDTANNEETDHDYWHGQGVPGSVPITINRPDAKPKPAPLSLASYRQEASLSDGVGVRNGRRRASSAARLPTTYETRHDE
ncbi:hypothetical protein VNI00_005780 [Paramarasmius palmivorus]|uniref:Uncharacterized protein n=1 Tax=Paramarasmius palmivorus TaxID=297713 RepID=A0AAW0DGB5_9AGAR